jgi:hypothetical protein
MIRVNIWLPDSCNVGHTSAEISCAGPSYSTYVSWWPNYDNILKAHEGRSCTYEEDMRAEGRPSDVRHEIETLDEMASAKWWTEFLASEKPNYKLGGTNCSWAVVSALKAGGSDSCFPWFRLLEKHNLKNLSLPKEEALLYYLLRVFTLVREGNSWEFAFSRPLIDLADDTLPVWSPRDAHAYCRLLIAGIRGEDLLKLPSLEDLFKIPSIKI